MRITWLVLIFGVAYVALGFDHGVQASKQQLPRMPKATLLVGYPPFNLYLTTATETQLLQQNTTQAEIEASISRDGAIVATATANGPDPNAKLAVATYSVLEKKWTEYTESLRIGRSIAISPDGSQLAYTTFDDTHKDSLRLHIIDIKTRTEKVSPGLGHDGMSSISWSPDGQHIVFAMTVNHSLPNGAPRPKSSIFLMDVETWKIIRLVDGGRPAWAPSGKWIAYTDYSPERAQAFASEAPPDDRMWLIHPDGTGAKLIAKLSGKRDYLHGVPIWSPDSKKILLTKLADWEKYTMDIYLLDCETLKQTRIFHDVLPIHGWVETK